MHFAFENIPDASDVFQFAVSQPTLLKTKFKRDLKNHPVTPIMKWNVQHDEGIEYSRLIKTTS